MFQPLGVAESDYRLLARAEAQYQLTGEQRERIGQVFGLELSQSVAANAAAVSAWLEARPAIGRYLLGLDPEAEADAGRGAWRWTSLADDYVDRPPIEWIVEGVIQAGALVVPFGPPAVGKTFVFQDLAVCVALGRPWLDPLPGMEAQVSTYQTEQATVLWVDVDNGEARVSRRFRALAQAREVQDPATVPLFHVSFPDPPFLANEDAAVGRLADYALLAGARLIVLDNLGTISGASDENTSQMIRVMLGLRRLAEVTGAAVVVIHHPNKAKEQIRGHTSILAAVDLALQIQRDEYEESEIAIMSVKSRDVPVPAFGARFAYTHDAQGELVSARFFGVGKPASAMSAQERAAECIRLNLKDGMNQSEIVDLVGSVGGVGRSSTLNAIKVLVDRGDLVEEAQGVSKVYRLGER